MLTQRKMGIPMGARKEQALRLALDSRLNLEFHRTRVTSNACLPVHKVSRAAWQFSCMLINP
jgi:hypothetical protein